MGLMMGLLAAFILAACSPGIPLDKTELSLRPFYYKGFPRSITWTTGDTARVRVFDSSRQALAVDGDGGTTVPLYWQADSLYWKGWIDLSQASSEVSGLSTFLAVVQDSEGRHVYRGTGSRNITPANFTETISLTGEAAYSPGDIGPAGGYVFYDFGEYSDLPEAGGWRYLEAAPEGVSAEPWGSAGVRVGSSGTGLGTGAANSSLIIAAQGEAAATASGACASYAANGFSDWFLPSRDEAFRMFLELSATDIADLGSGAHWTSSEYATATANTVDLATGTRVFAVDKTLSKPARPARCF